MTRGRLEAFSDGVIAIIITIMVLELRPPHEPGLAALRPVLPRLMIYVLSFTFLGIYWNNHHHMFQAVRRVGGAVLWANLHLLFWLTLVPFVTAWIGESHAAPVPTAMYGTVLLLAALAYFTLQSTIIAHEGKESILRKAVGPDWKGKLSPLIYVSSIPLAFVDTRISIALFVLVALLWLIPDRRIEQAIREDPGSK